MRINHEPSQHPSQSKSRRDLGRRGQPLGARESSPLGRHAAGVWGSLRSSGGRRQPRVLLREKSWTSLSWILQYRVRAWRCKWTICVGIGTGAQPFFSHRFPILRFSCPTSVYGIRIVDGTGLQREISREYVVNSLKKCWSGRLAQVESLSSADITIVVRTATIQSLTV